MALRSISATFSRIARATASVTGHVSSFIVAALLIIIWGLTGPIFHYSDTWQLVVNTATTIITFLMVFLIQHTQNRDTEALQVKLDELIRAVAGAQNALIALEDVDDEQLAEIRANYRRMAREARGETEPVILEAATVVEKVEVEIGAKLDKTGLIVPG